MCLRTRYFLQPEEEIEPGLWRCRGRLDCPRRPRLTGWRSTTKPEHHRRSRARLCGDPLRRQAEPPDHRVGKSGLRPVARVDDRLFWRAGHLSHPFDPRPGGLSSRPRGLPRPLHADRHPSLGARDARRRVRPRLPGGRRFREPPINHRGPRSSRGGPPARGPVPSRCDPYPSGTYALASVLGRQLVEIVGPERFFELRGSREPQTRQTRLQRLAGGAAEGDQIRVESVSQLHRLLTRLTSRVRAQGASPRSHDGT